MRASRIVLSLFAASLLVLPFASTQAATFEGARTLSVATTSPDNIYAAALDLAVRAPVLADLIAAGATLTVAAPVTGDALLAGGTVTVQKPVGGDLRAAAVRLTTEDSVTGDLVAAGGIVAVQGTPHDVRIAGGTVDLQNGANGPVTIYGAEVSLAGTFNGDVEVVSADRITLAEGTVIRGAFRYNAPQQPEIPASVQLAKGKTYIGSSTFLPTVQEAHTFAIASVWVFFLVRALALLVLAGLCVGLFPVLTERVVRETLTRSPERFILFGLLGLAGLIVTPVIILVLLVSFVGVGLAIVIAAGYTLFLVLSYVFGAVLTGAFVLRSVGRKQVLTWRGALLGALIFFILGLIPILGLVITVILSAVAGGGLLSQFYMFAFKTRGIE